MLLERQLGPKDLKSNTKVSNRFTQGKCIYIFFTPDYKCLLLDLSMQCGQ